MLLSTPSSFDRSGRHLIRVLPLVSLICVSAVSVLPLTARADQVFLNSDEIRAFLADRHIKGEQKGVKWLQSFSADGSTTYEELNGFRPTLGRWKADNDQYCSQWPPSDIWACYRFSVDGDQLTFVPQTGDVWPAVRSPLK